MAQYAEIRSIEAPSVGTAGKRVDIEVTVKNLYSSTIGIMVGGALEYGVTPWPTITFPSNWDNVPGGATKTFSGYFTMPAYNTKIHAYSWYYAAGWNFDDEATEDISAWIKLASASLLVKSGKVGWIKLASASLLVKRELVGVWIPLASASLLVKRGGFVGGWVPLANAQLSVDVGLTPGTDIFKQLSVEFLRKEPVIS